MRNLRPIHGIGGGLAGSEAAWQIARHGVPVVLHEMRPVRATAVHKTGQFAELVCSNSFRSDDADGSAIGLLHAEMRRLGSLVLHTADLMDRVGVKRARSEISQIKVACAQIGNRIADTAIQAFGAAGLTDDFGIGYHYARMRVLRIADGPDEVHNRTIAQLELRRFSEVHK